MAELRLVRSHEHCATSKMLSCLRTSFRPWNIWRVSIYSPTRCPKCAAKLIRRRDLQFFLGPFIILCILGISLLLHWSPRTFVVCASLVMILVVWPIDALTVRLVQAGPWRGWLHGYET